MTPDDQWITKQEAGTRLGVSGRRIHDLAKFGQIQSCQVRDSDTGHMAIRIHAGSVERYIFERDNPGRITTSVAPRSTGANKDVKTQIEEVIRYLATIARPALAVRLWLTVTESAAYSGLPVTVITGFIANGKLAAMDVGRRRRGGRWRIRKVDLEEFVG